MNAKMPELKRCFESAGFSKMRTLLSSGNVVFDTRSAPHATLERRCEKAIASGLDRSFETFIRRASGLQALLDADPFAEFDLPAGAKRIVTFLHRPFEGKLGLPIERDDARILKINGADVLGYYVPGP